MRGKKARNGTTRTSPNGYHYTKTKGGWRLTHHIIAERTLGRLLKSGERVHFADGDRTNLSGDNLVVRKTRPKSTNSRRAHLEAKIADLQHELENLNG